MLSNIDIKPGDFDHAEEMTKQIDIKHIYPVESRILYLGSSFCNPSIPPPQIKSNSLQEDHPWALSAPIEPRYKKLFKLNRNLCLAMVVIWCYLISIQSWNTFALNILILF